MFIVHLAWRASKLAKTASWESHVPYAGKWNTKIRRDLSDFSGVCLSVANTCVTIRLSDI